MKKLLSLLLFMLPIMSYGQIDTEFWFVAPDVTEGTGFEPRRDSTVFIVLSALNEPAEARINQPANLSFQPIIVNLAANTTQAINLGVFLSLLETKPANTVLNTGVLIRSTAPITAYYEIRAANNREIFSLKGKNALGTKFYTPYENSYGSNEFFNALPYLPPPRSGFVVVASQDSTTVQITPKLDVLGHPANSTFEVMLMRGQSYAVEAIDGDVSNKPIGTRIESNKPVAVTIKDDMIDFDLSNTGGADIAADQMFALEYAGQQHIAIRGDLPNNLDRVVVLATADGTELTVDGNPIATILNEGEQYVYNFNGPSSYIESSEKVYVFHATGQSDQLCGALLPPLECTGSTQVGFVRPTLGPFFSLHLAIRDGAQGNFTLNGNPALIPASAFAPVPGTNGEYVFAKIQYSTAQIPLGSANIIENSGDELFHVGLLTATSGNSANFGYFSAFSYLNIGDFREVCLNSETVLDAGPGKTGYLWSTGETTQSITVNSPGTYFVDVFSGTQCAASDTIVVTYYEPPISLGANDTICAGTSKVFNIEGNFLLLWQDGSTGPSIEVSEEGWVWVEVTDFQECTLRDSTFVSVRPRPETPEVSGDDTYCEGETLQLTLSPVDNASYRFITPSNTLTFNQTLVIENLGSADAGMYYGFVVVEGCESFSDSIMVEVIQAPVVQLPGNENLCDGESYIIEPVVDGDALSFVWQDGSDTPTFVATENGTYYLTVFNSAGCAGSDTLTLTFNPQPDNPMVTGNEPNCEGASFAVNTQVQAGVTYTWTDPNGNVISTGNSINIVNAGNAVNGTYTVQAALGNCVSDLIEFDIAIFNNPVVTLPNDTIVCNGEEVVLTVEGDFASIEWSTGQTGPVVVVGAGNYSVTVTNEIGCSGSDAIAVTETGPEAGFSRAPTGVVEPETVIAFTDLSTPSGAQIVSRLWSFGDGGSSTSTNPTHQYIAAGTYTVTLLVTDSEGCTDSATSTVEVRYDLVIPGGFSPNGDGVNDLFVIRGLDVWPESSLQIFNRWGMVVYESMNYPNNWNGGSLPDGTYFYILKLRNGEDFAGPVTLAR